MQRYLVDAYGPEEHTMQIAVRMSVFLAFELQCPVTILVDCMDSTSENQPLRDFFGSSFDTLIAERTVRFRKTEFRIIETDDIPAGSTIQIALAAFASPRTLNMIESRDDTEAIVAVPWLETDTVEWERRFNPKLVNKDALQT